MARIKGGEQTSSYGDDAERTPGSSMSLQEWMQKEWPGIQSNSDPYVKPLTSDPKQFLNSKYSAWRLEGDKVVFRPESAEQTPYQPKGSLGTDFLKYGLPAFGLGFGLESLMRAGGGLSNLFGGGPVTDSGVAGWSSEIPPASSLLIGDGAPIAEGELASELSNFVPDPSENLMDRFNYTGLTDAPLTPGGPFNGFKMPFPTPGIPNPGSDKPFESDYWPAMTTPNGIDPVTVGTGAATLARLLKDAGIDVDPSTLDLIGKILKTGGGIVGSIDEKNSIEKAKGDQNRILQEAIDYQRGIQKPFIDDALNIMQNPDQFYQRPEVMGAIDASLRGLSAKVGNPINNPGAIAQQAAYNTGLYNNTLNSRLATAYGGQDSLNRLMTQQSINAGQPVSNANLFNTIGSGLQSMLSTNPNISTLLSQYLTPRP